MTFALEIAGVRVERTGPFDYPEARMSMMSESIYASPERLRALARMLEAAADLIDNSGVPRQVAL